MRKIALTLVAFVVALACMSAAVRPVSGSVPDLSPANRPQLTAASLPGGIQLTWTDPHPENVVGYLVRRGPAPGEQDRWPLTDFPVVGNGFVDRNVVPGDTYYYVVIPLMANGAMGRTSSEAEATAAVVPAGYKQITLNMEMAEAQLLTSEGTAAVALTAAPVYDRGRVMLALADLKSLLGAEITYDQTTGEIVQTLPGGRVLHMAVGKCCLTFNLAVKPDVCSPVMRGGQLFLPLRWIVEGMEGAVSFDTLSHSVFIEFYPLGQ